MPTRSQSLGSGAGNTLPLLAPAEATHVAADAASIGRVLEHRSDLDGIRGIAIIAVVMYHVGAWTLPGAFVGVDLFFVLSGYLITQIVIERQRRQAYSMTDFYMRRARRILPALFTMLAATSILALACLTPPELKDFAQSMASAASFVSNGYFLQLQDGYFEPSNALTPLLMTWSLSVEAQFYLLFPLLFLPFVRRFVEPRRAIFALLILSFAGACLVLVESRKAAFYLLPTRAWELLLGAWLATLPSVPKSKTLHEALGALACILIAGSFVFLHAHMPFPGWNALAPCVGTALLLVSTRSWVNTRLLSSSPLVFLGKISYSVYLWHWPLLSLSWVIWGKELGPARLGTLLAATFVLACLSYRFVERPARLSKLPARSAASGYLAATAALVIAGVLVAHLRGLPGRMDASGQELLAKSNLETPLIVAAKQWSADMMAPLPGHCFRIFGEPQVLADDCATTVVDGTGTALLWGDSQAAHFFPGVSHHMASRGYAVRVASMGGCRPYKYKDKEYNDPFKRACEERNRAVMDMIADRPDLNPIILAGRWSSHASGAPKNLVRFDREMHGLVDALRALDRTVIILGEVPEFRSGPVQCLLRQHLPMAPKASCHTSIDLIEKLQAPTRAALQSAAESPGACIVDTRDVFCPAGICSPFLANGTEAYWDGTHLTRAGSIWLSTRHAFDSCDAAWSRTTAPAMATEIVTKPALPLTPPIGPATDRSS